MNSLTIVPCRRRRDDDRERTDALLAQAHADLMADYSPGDMTPEQVLCAQRLMLKGYGYGLSMCLARSTGWTVPS